MLTGTMAVEVGTYGMVQNKGLACVCCVVLHVSTAQWKHRRCCGGWAGAAAAAVHVNVCLWPQLQVPEITCVTWQLQCLCDHDTLAQGGVQSQAGISTFAAWVRWQVASWSTTADIVYKLCSLFSVLSFMLNMRYHTRWRTA
jgi:hypothetical protein